MVSNHALRKLAKKQLQAWRPIQTRLLLLKQLVKVTLRDGAYDGDDFNQRGHLFSVVLLRENNLTQETALSSTSGLSADAVMNFAKDVNAFVHSSGEVRDAARELTIAVYEVRAYGPTSIIAMRVIAFGDV